MDEFFKTVLHHVVDSARRLPSLIELQHLI